MRIRITLKALAHAGYSAGFNRMPFVSPTSRELERDAWENGWREGHNEREAQPCAICGAAGNVEAFQGRLAALGYAPKQFAHAVCIAENMKPEVK